MEFTFPSCHFITNLFSPSNQQIVNKHQKTVEAVNALEKEYETKSQDDLKALTAKWKEQLAGKEWEEQKKFPE
jgi:preprotein translocase subunit SecA